MNALLDLAARWREEAGLLRGYGASEAAAAAESHAEQLTEAIEEADHEKLTLDEAARASNYSKRRLRELVADGSIPNYGRKGAPRIQRKDLPKRAGSVKKADSFDASSEAQSILGETGLSA